MAIPLRAGAQVGAAFGKVGDTVKDGFKTIGDAFRGLGRRRTQSKSQLVKMLTKGCGPRGHNAIVMRMRRPAAWHCSPRGLPCAPASSYWPAAASRITRLRAHVCVRTFACARAQVQREGLHDAGQPHGCDRLLVAHTRQQ